MFANTPQDPNFNPKLYVPTGWDLPQQSPDLEDKLYYMCKELRRNIAVNKPHWRNNLTKQKRIELKELKANPDIRIFPADKNLGPAVMSTNRVQTETLRHLHDELSYCKVMPEDWYVSHRNVIDSRENLMSIYSRFISSNVARFLHSLDHFVSLNSMLSLRYIRTHRWKANCCLSFLHH